MRSGAAAVGVFFLALPSVASLSACGSPSPARVPSAAPARAPGPEARAPELVAEGGLPSLDALAARGPTDAPLMREALRTASAAPRSTDVRAEKDLCVRAVFAASVAVRAWFADEGGASRGETTAAASGTVPPRGPVCMKKGEALHLVVESADGTSAANARAVIFAAP